MTAATVEAVLLLIDAVRGVMGKKPRAAKAVALLGKKKEAVGAYLTGCAKLQAAADAGTGLGPLTPDEVAAIATVDDQLVRLAGKVAARLP